MLHEICYCNTQNDHLIICSGFGFYSYIKIQFSKMAPTCHSISLLLKYEKIEIVCIVS